MNLSHEEILDKMLSNACPSEDLGNEKYSFVIDSHCMTYNIVAKRLGWDEEKEYGKYEIISFGMESN